MSRRLMREQGLMRVASRKELVPMTEAVYLHSWKEFSATVPEKDQN